jgi:hypothetical protein
VCAAAQQGTLPDNTLRLVFLVNCLPFIGFGFLDNMIMIVAGEYIDMTLGSCVGCDPHLMQASP